MKREVNFVLKAEFDTAKVCINKEACSICKGAYCCQNTGCVFSPKDFQILRYAYTKEERIKYLIAFLNRGYASIDHYRLIDRKTGALDADTFFIEDITVNREKLLKGEGALYLRARNINKDIVDVIHIRGMSSTGPCVLWSEEKGCKLSYRKRPKGGRLVIPQYNIFENKCIALYNEPMAAIEWYPYQDILYEVYMHFKTN